MKTIYGREGQPAGSIDGDAVYWKDGSQIGVLDGDYIYAADGGEWLGSTVAGVIYNAFGEPVGFTKGCARSIPPMPPKLRSLLPPTVASMGPDVRSVAAEAIPDFLAHMTSIP